MTQLVRKVVFVFGSNLAGVHGAGAAKEAALYWGAQRGVGEGITGNSYALPTKDQNIQTLSLDLVIHHFNKFMDFVLDNPDIQFLLTPIGTGLAGFDLTTIKTLTGVLNNPPRNLWLTGDWFRG